MFENTQELQQYVSVSSAYSISKGFDVQINRAVNNHVKPLLGAKLFNKLEINRKANVLNTHDLNLYAEIKTIVGNFAVLYDLPVKAVMISDGGINRMESDNKPSAYKYQVSELKQSLAEAGFEATERLMDLLAAYEDHYPDWQESDVYVTRKSALIADSVTFSSYVYIANSRIVFVRLQNALKKTTDLELNNAIGAPLLKRLQAKLKNNLVDAIDLELLQMLRPVLANFTAARVIRNPAELSEWTALGFRVLESKREADLSNYSAPSPQWLNGSAQEYERDAASYQVLLIKFLNKNVGKYPEFKNSNNHINTDKDEIIKDDSGAFFF
jgi:hypothetical protein